EIDRRRRGAWRNGPTACTETDEGSGGDRSVDEAASGDHRRDPFRASFGVVREATISVSKEGVSAGEPIAARAMASGCQMLVLPPLPEKGTPSKPRRKWPDQ